MKTLVIWIVGGLVGIVLVSYLAWFFFFRAAAAPAANTAVSGGLGLATTQSTGAASGNTSSNNTNQTTPIGDSSSLKVFKIADGPVTGATFVQTFGPTTTLARYVLQENGHVMDQPIDVPGSLPHPVSNTTIPGTEVAQWGSQSTLYMQYQDGAAVKTVLLAFPPAATSSQSVTRPVNIQFLPDNITSLAVSPDGSQIAYLLPSASGSDGYIAKNDGSNGKKLFSVGLSQLLLSWPSANILLMATKSSESAPGIVFSVNAKTGGIVPLIYADGLTAIADRAFDEVVYQSAAPGAQARSTYAHNVANNTDVALSFDPIPEKCTWGSASPGTLYCAAPVQYVNAQYLDLWHMGLATAPDSILSFVPSDPAQTTAIAVPGSSDGGEASDIIGLTVSPDDKYLLFIKKGDRSLWAVRLGQN